jgi:chromatin remodeling complex protein RSC6
VGALSPVPTASEERSMAAKKAKKKATKKAATKKKAAKKPAKKKSARKPSAAFMKPMTLSAALAAVIGSGPMPRTEVTKKLWAYIKRNKLQDAKNRRMINPDEKLGMVLKKSVSMFDMTKIVSKHLS